jgi:outer membrane protein assembly factor BamB
MEESMVKQFVLCVLLCAGCLVHAQTVVVPTSYAYGTKRAGSSNLWIMTIQNQGGVLLSVDSIRFATGSFSVDANATPLLVPASSSRRIRVWFSPTTAAPYSDTMRIHSNATNLPVAPVALSGEGDTTAVPLGTPFWTHTVPLHPVSNTTRRVRAVRVIGDISGDGKPDVIVCTDNYWTMALNGNASGGNDSLWAFNTYIANYSAGPVGSEGDYSYQKALAIASDLNGDGFNDVVIGTGGGNEHVYAINGRTGQMLWTFGSDHPDSFSLGDITGVDVSTDFNNDGVPDVIAASAATQSGGLGGRRSIYLFNGANGSIMWQAPALGFTHAVAAIPDISGDGIPDVIGTIGEPLYKASAYSGANGSPLWDFQLNSTSGGGKELLVWPVAGQTPDIIVGAFWGPIFRLDGESGTIVWQRSTNGRDPTRLARLRDINGDGVDEIVASLLVGDALCLDGANGDVLWSYPANSGMDITTCRDLNGDGYDEVVVASQNEDVLILRGNNGQLLFSYPLPGSSEQARSVAVMQDIDGNHSFEILAGSDASRVVLLSGGLNAGPVSVGEPKELPTGFTLAQNYPNPFNPTTRIRFTLQGSPPPAGAYAEAGPTTLKVYDLLGREVATLVNGELKPGSYEVTFNATGLASGVYFYRLQSGAVTINRRMLLLR